MAEKEKILFADDDEQIREVVRLLLESEGYRVVEAANGLEAISKADESFDLFILDIMMPGCTGLTACAEIRKKSTAPILFLTARSQDSDKTIGFSAGADDYLPKPFSSSELLARVKAALRRYLVYGSKNKTSPKNQISIQDIVIDADNMRVTKAGQEILFTETEYHILYLLASNRRKVFSVQNIYESVWNEPYYYTSNNTVMVHVRNIRRKLQDDQPNGEIIKTVWGRGYRVD